MIKLLESSVPGETSLPGLQTAASSPCAHMAFPLCTWKGETERERERERERETERAGASSSFYRAQALVD